LSALQFGHTIAVATWGTYAEVEYAYIIVQGGERRNEIALHSAGSYLIGGKTWQSVSPVDVFSGAWQASVSDYTTHPTAPLFVA
jgi:hypothetical protein